MRMSLASKFSSRPSEDSRERIAPGDRQATVIAVAAQKGGVGKTTTAVSLAAALARFHDKRVLVVDLDSQSQASLALRDLVEIGGGPLTDVLTDRFCDEVEEIVTSTRIDNLFITPRDPHLLRAEDRMASRIGKEMVLRKALEITRTHYDVILLDCPPNVGTLTINGLVAADHVLIPCNPTALAVAGVSGMLTAVDDVNDQLSGDVKVLGLVLTQVDGRNKTTNAAALDLLQQSFGEQLLPIEIGTSNSLAAAQMAGRDIFDFDPSSRGARHYKALAELVLERIDTAS